MSRVKQQPPVSPWRFYLVVAVLLVFPVALIDRLATLQVFNGERGVKFLQEEGDNRSIRVLEVPASRGMITDRRGEPLAVSTPVVSLWVDPAALDPGSVEPLAKAMEMRPSELRQKLNDYEGKRFMFLARRLPPVKARKVLALGIIGVHEQRDYRRYYPAGEYAAQLVGIANVDDKGISGLELAYDQWLRGVAGKRKVVVSGKVKNRRRINEVVNVISDLKPVQPGRDLRLSIDLRMQYVQYRELERAVLETGAYSGTAVTLDIKTGEVLAVANYPSYNPNSRQNIDRHIKRGDTRNRAMIDVLEPGSIMKTFTMIAALETGRYSLDSVIHTAPGYIKVGDKRIADPRNYGSLTLKQVLAKSSQVGTAKLALEVEVQPIWNVFNRFGLGQTTGSSFPGEGSGELPVKENRPITEQVTLAYGYGVSVTPLQLARAYAAVANDGVLLPVSLLALEDNVETGQRVVDSRIAKAMLGALAGVVKKDGTAGRARVPGYAVGGKTGTVRKLEQGRYRDDRHYALFAGVAPVDEPKVVTVVVINDPRGEEHGGGAVAAPVFSRIVAGIMPLLSVPPQESALLANAAAMTGGEGL